MWQNISIQVRHLPRCSTNQEPNPPNGDEAYEYVKIVQTKNDLQIDPRFQDPNNGLNKNDTTYLSLLDKNKKNKDKINNSIKCLNCSAYFKKILVQTTFSVSA